MKADKLKHCSIIFVLVIIYRILLDYCYEYGVVKYYAHEGFCYYHDMKWTIASWMVLIVLTFLAMPVLMNDGKRISSLVVTVLFVMIFVPYTTYIKDDHQSIPFVVGCTLYWTLIFMLQCLSQKIKIVCPQRATVSKQMSGGLLEKFIGIASLLVILYISGRYTHFRFMTDIINVYGIRSEAKTYGLSTALRYAYSFTKAVCPFMILHSYIKRDWKNVLMYLFIQFLSFGIEGEKTTFFTPWMLLLFCFLVERLRKWKNAEIVFISFGSVAVISILEQIVVGTHYIIFLILYRMMYSVVKLNTYYFDFFFKHTPDYFASSFLRFFGAKSIYEMNIANMIAGLYIGNYEVVSNNGLVSDAVMNFGFAGVFIMPFFLILFLHIFDICSWGHDVRVLLPIAVQISISLSNVPLVTTLLSSGLLIFMILLALVSRGNRNDCPIAGKKKFHILSSHKICFTIGDSGRCL